MTPMIDFDPIWGGVPTMVRSKLDNACVWQAAAEPPFENFVAKMQHFPT